MTKLRLTHYDPQRVKLPRRLMKQIRLHKLGRFAGRTVWIVNGSVVRAYVDVDFALGGNPARYSYVPAGELWVEDTGDESDVRATAVHEAVETAHMLDGMSYDEAHDLASAQETRLRTTGKGMPVFVPNPQEPFFHVIGYGLNGQPTAHDMQSERARAKYAAQRMLRDDFDVVRSAVFVGTLEEHEAQPIMEFFAEVPVAVDAVQASNGYYSFWISPDGDIYPVEPYKHVEVESRLVKFLLVSRTQETMTSYSPALAAGWLQVSEEGNVLFGFDRPPTQRQLDAVFDLAQAHKARVWSGGSHLHEVFWQSAMRWLNEPAATRNPSEPEHIKTVCMYCKKVIFDGPLDSAGMVSHAVCYDCAVEHAEEIGFIQEDLEEIRVSQGR